MSTSSDRTDSLDEVLDGAELTEALPADLFAVSDVLDTEPALRRALTDQGAESGRRRQLVEAIFGSRLGGSAVHVVAEASAQRWPGGRAFADAIERSAVRAQLRLAAQNGRLDDVEDELFRFERTVASDPDLRSTISDRSAGVERRRQLVAQLLDGRASAETSVLAQRAVGSRDGSFAGLIADYITVAADLRDRTIATVRVARPLDSDQAERLQRALSRYAGREVTLQTVVDPHVLGGIRVEMGSEVIDGTVESKLADANRLFG